jgi:hypothetical protein
MQTAAELRAMADQVEQIEALQHAKVAAQAAYRSNPSDPDARERHRAASEQLNTARAKLRAGRGVTVPASTVTGKGGAR